MVPPGRSLREPGTSHRSCWDIHGVLRERRELDWEMEARVAFSKMKKKEQPGNDHHSPTAMRGKGGGGK